MRKGHGHGPTISGQNRRGCGRGGGGIGGGGGGGGSGGVGVTPVAAAAAGAAGDGGGILDGQVLGQLGQALVHGSGPFEGPGQSAFELLHHAAHARLFAPIRVMHPAPCRRRNPRCGDGHLVDHHHNCLLPDGPGMSLLGGSGKGLVTERVERYS